MLDQLEKSRVRLKGRVLHRDSLPLWQVVPRRQQARAPTSCQRQCPVIGIESFAQENSGVFTTLAVLRCCHSSAHTDCQWPDPCELARLGTCRASALEITRHWWR